MTEPKPEVSQIYAGPEAGAPAWAAAAMAKEMQSQIASVQVRLLGLEPGQSEIELNIAPSGPLGAGAYPPGIPGHQKESYIKAFGVFINAVKRELDKTYAGELRGNE